MWKRNTCTQQTNAFICGLENRLQYVRVQLKLSPRFSFFSVSPLLKESFSSCSFPAFVAFERIRVFNLSLLISLPAILVCSITPQASLFFFFVWIFHFFLFRVFIFLIVLQRRLQLVEHCDDIRIVFLVMVDLLLRAFLGHTVHVLCTLLHLFSFFSTFRRSSRFRLGCLGLTEAIDGPGGYIVGKASLTKLELAMALLSGVSEAELRESMVITPGISSRMNPRKLFTATSHRLTDRWKYFLSLIVDRFANSDFNLPTSAAAAVEAVVTLRIHRKKFLPSAFLNCDINKHVSSS